MPRRIREVVTHTWQSEANLAFFFALLVLFIFVLPSLGLETKHELFYSDVVSSLVLISGAAIAWRRRTVFLLASGIVTLALLLKWVGLLAPVLRLGIWPDIATIVAIVMVVYILLSRAFAAGPVTQMRIMGAVRAALAHLGQRLRGGGKMTGENLKHRIYHEMKELLLIALYLWLIFALLALHSQVILAEHNIEYGAQGIALFNALALGKVMLAARKIPRVRPLS